MMPSLRAFAEALFSTEAGAPSAERMDWLMKEMEEYLQLAGPGARVVFGLALFAVTWLSPLFIRRLPTLGTCRMGPSKETSVVDPWGECWELPGCTIADGSVVPTSLGVNPQLTIMTMALRIAHHLAEA